MNKNAHGFTIVELLIVIVVIGILAAISIVAYNGISNNANDSAVQSDLRNMGQRFEMYKAEHGLWPNSTQVSSMGIGVSKGSYGNHADGGYNLPYCFNNTASQSGMAIVGMSKSGNAYVYKNGSISEFEGIWQTNITQLCAAAGVTYQSRVWMLEAGEWKPFLN